MQKCWSGIVRIHWRYVVEELLAPVTASSDRRLSSTVEWPVVRRQSELRIGRGRLRNVDLMTTFCPTAITSSPAPRSSVASRTFTPTLRPPCWRTNASSRFMRRCDSGTSWGSLGEGDLPQLVMVFESTDRGRRRGRRAFGFLHRCPVRLPEAAVEYFARAAWDQYGLPYPRSSGHSTASVSARFGRSATWRSTLAT